MPSRLVLMYILLSILENWAKIPSRIRKVINLMRPTDKTGIIRLKDYRAKRKRKVGNER